MSSEQLQPPKAGKSEPANSKGHSVDPERWLEEYGDELFSFTVLRVRDRGTAQDLVQETFLAALKARQSFAVVPPNVPGCLGLCGTNWSIITGSKVAKSPYWNRELSPPRKRVFFIPVGQARMTSGACGCGYTIRIQKVEDSVGTNAKAGNRAASCISSIDESTVSRGEQNEVFDGLWREAADDFGGVLVEFLKSI